LRRHSTKLLQYFYHHPIYLGNATVTVVPSRAIRPTGWHRSPILWPSWTRDSVSHGAPVYSPAYTGTKLYCLMTEAMYVNDLPKVALDSRKSSTITTTPLNHTKPKHRQTRDGRRNKHKQTNQNIISRQRQGSFFYETTTGMQA